MLVKVDRYEKRRKRIAARPHKYISYLGSIDKFEVKYPVGKTDKGTPLYFLPIKRYSELKAALERKDEIERKIYGRLLRDKKITLADIFENIIRKNELRAEATISGYKNVMEAFKNSNSVTVKDIWLNTDIGALTSEKMGEAFNELAKAKKWTRATATLYKTKISAVINAEETRNFIRGVAFFTENITAFKISVKNKPVTQERNYYSMEELHKIYMELERIGGETELVFKIQIATGARIGEICGLMVDDIDGGIISFTKQIDSLDVNKTMPLKTGNIRYTPIPEVIQNEIEKLIKKRCLESGAFIFKSRWRSNQRMRLRDISIKSGVKITEGRSTHGFRRSLTTFVKGSMLERGVISDSINFERYIGHKVSGVPEMYNKSYMEKDSQERFRLIIGQYLNAIQRGDEVFRIDYMAIEDQLYRGDKDKVYEVGALPKNFINGVLKLAQEYGLKS